MQKTIWSTAEIIRSYKRGGCTARQIGIIAECNVCDRETIEKILQRSGYEPKDTRKEPKNKETQKKPEKKDPEKEWIPLDFDEDMMMACPPPDDGEIVLVSYKGEVDTDIFLEDIAEDGTPEVYFENTPIARGVAWRRFPKPWSEDTQE